MRSSRGLGPAVGDDPSWSSGSRAWRGARRRPPRATGRAWWPAACRRTTAGGRRRPTRRSRGARRSPSAAAARPRPTRSRRTPPRRPGRGSGGQTRDRGLEGGDPRGVKPRLTSDRRRRCSGSSIEIIIGRGGAVGRGCPAAGERRRVLLDGEDVVVAGDAPDVGGLVVVDGRLPPHPRPHLVRVVGVPAAVEEVEALTGGVLRSAALENGGALLGEGRQGLGQVRCRG